MVSSFGVPASASTIQKFRNKILEIGSYNKHQYVPEEITIGKQTKRKKIQPKL